MRFTVHPERLPALDDERGLTDEEAGERRRAFGGNEIVERRRRSWTQLARETFGDPMIWFLVATSAVYFVLSQPVEGFTLLAAIAPLMGMDAFLHWRTQASTEGLSRRLAAEAQVTRSGATRRIAAIDLVVGDLVDVRGGEYFPADGVLVGGDDMQVEESSLTGEAYPVRKRAVREIPASGLLDAEHWGLAGTRLLTGRARVRIAEVGAHTLYGAIARSAAQGLRDRTPMQAAIGRLVGLLMVVAAALCLLLALVRWWQGHGWIDALVSAATLGVAALPEEFPVAFTFFLGAGVFRLARRHALVRRAVTVENIGRVTVICSDKTGTLTEGRLRVTELVPASGITEEKLLATARTASRPEAGDPLDVAIHAAAKGAPPIAGEIAVTFPFTEERRRETVVVRTKAGAVACIKGSPEVVIASCAMSAESRREWTARVAVLAQRGGKVIGCASVALPEGWTGSEPLDGLVLTGLLVCEDPIRAGVPESIAECRAAGIHPLMVTGDHPSTAKAVARSLGLGGGEPAVVLGEHLEDFLRGKTAAELRHVDVIARAIPSQKLALVHALQAAGEIVAVTGDGVNDVPALQAADIGIAMGERGTQSAREAASIVLLDDDFRSIAGAIAEGRQLFRNLRTSFLYLLLVHIPFVVTAALIPFAGYPLLYLPIHVVWLELVLHPTALLVFQQATSGAPLDRLPVRAHARFFSPADAAAIALCGALSVALLVHGYDRSLGSTGDVAHARAVSLAFLTFESAFLAAVLSGMRTKASWIVGLATLASTIALVQVPMLARRLDLRPLHLDDWAVVLVTAALAVLPIALWEARLRRANDPSRDPRPLTRMSISLAPGKPGG